MVIIAIDPGGVAPDGFSCGGQGCGHQTASCAGRVAEASGEANLLTGFAEKQTPCKSEILRGVAAIENEERDCIQN